MPKALTEREKELGRKFRRYFATRKKGKLLYDEARKLLNDLLKEVSDPASFRIPAVRSRKRFFKFKNNFAESNTCFRAHGIDQFEAEIEELA